MPETGAGSCCIGRAAHNCLQGKPEVRQTPNQGALGQSRELLAGTFVENGQLVSTIGQKQQQGAARHYPLSHSHPSATPRHGSEKKSQNRLNQRMHEHDSRDIRGRQSHPHGLLSSVPQTPVT